MLFSFLISLVLLSAIPPSVYSSPLRLLGIADPSDSTAAIAAATANSTAATARLDGVAKDLDNRITRAQGLAESGVVNSHCNFKAINDLDEALASLSVQFQSQSQGVVDRHTNQIRTQSDRLDQHSSELRGVQQLISSHQSRLESLAAENKKFVEAVAELTSNSALIEKQCVERVKIEIMVLSETVKRQCAEAVEESTRAAQERMISRMDEEV